MKREGRQHGLVRAYPILPSPWNPKPNSKFVNQFDSPSTAGSFTRVSSKPTNHSKYTGKCGRVRCNECHCNPACKSRDKAKGTQKVRASDLIAWKVVSSSGRGFDYSGVSATAFLGHLCSDYDYEEEVEDHVDDLEEETQEQEEFEAGEVEIEEDGEEEEEDDDDDDDDGMSFCDVGFVIDEVDGDEEWCIVEEL